MSRMEGDKISVSFDQKKKTMTITIPMRETPEPSRTGKTLVFATTNGAVKCTAKHPTENLPVYLNLNAYVNPTKDR